MHNNLFYKKEKINFMFVKNTNLMTLLFTKKKYSKKKNFSYTNKEYKNV